MKNIRRISRFMALVSAIVLLSFVPAISFGESKIMSPDEYLVKYRAMQIDGAGAAELASLLEEGLKYYSEDRDIRYILMFEYTILHDDEKAKICAKEALQYEPQSKFYAHIYLINCSILESPDEAKEAAEYVLALCESGLPPAGDKAVIGVNYDINSYDYLSYCMDAYTTLFNISIERNDSKSALICSDWILMRKDDSELGFDRGLYVMAKLVIYYGKLKKFDEMNKWMDQYFAFEVTADEKGDGYKQIRSNVKKMTELLSKIKDEYLAHGSEIDVQDIINQSL